MRILSTDTKRYVAPILIGAGSAILADQYMNQKIVKLRFPDADKGNPYAKTTTVVTGKLAAGAGLIAAGAVLALNVGVIDSCYQATSYVADCLNDTIDFVNDLADTVDGD